MGLIGPIGYDDSMGPLSLVVFSGLVACVPLVVGSLFLRWLGRGDCEPRRLLRTVLLFGATFGVFFGLLGSTVLSLLFPAALGRGLVLVTALLSPGQELSPLRVARVVVVLDTALTAPLAEELAKGLVLVLLWRARALCSRVSGLVYGGAVGMGFAIAENFCYFVSTYWQDGLVAWESNLLIRTLFAAWMHVAASAACGLWPGLAVEAPLPAWKQRLAPVLGLGTAWVIHALWNSGMLLAEALGEGSFTYHLFAAVPLVAALLLLLLERGLRAEAEGALGELQLLAAEGLIPADEAPIIAAYRARRGVAWLPPSLRPRRDVYLRTLLRLCQCRRASRVSSDPRRALAFAAEADALRAEVKALRSSL